MLLVSLMSCFGNAKAGNSNLGERHVRSCCSFGRTTEAAILATIWHSVCRVAAQQRNFARSFTAPVNTLFAHTSAPSGWNSRGYVCGRSSMARGRGCAMASPMSTRIVLYGCPTSFSVVCHCLYQFLESVGNQRELCCHRSSCTVASFPQRRPALPHLVTEKNKNSALKAFCTGLVQE